jgi:hypothetical protein
MASWFGFLFAGFSVLAFGSSYIPVKAYDTGDGMFFQWVMGASIFLVGLVVNLIRYGMTYPTVEPFQPIAMLGGFLWATGNITVVPIMGMIGIGLGMLTWGLCNMIVGWAVPNFGLFGLAAQAPQGTLATVKTYAPNGHLLNEPYDFAGVELWRCSYCHLGHDPIRHAREQRRRDASRKR